MNTQLSLFNEDLPGAYNGTTIKYQIKRFDNSQFNLELNLEAEQDAYEKALERLGYFIVPEADFSFQDSYGNS